MDEARGFASWTVCAVRASRLCGRQRNPVRQEAMFDSAQTSAWLEATLGATGLQR